MLDARAFREDLELETVIGNITAVIYHQGENFWVVNHFPWLLVVVAHIPWPVLVTSPGPL